MRAKEFTTQLNELNMAPGNLMKFAMSPAAANMRAGFEAELIMPGEFDDSMDSEPDWDADSTLPRGVDMSDVQEYFQISGRDQALSELQEDFQEFVNDQMSQHVDRELPERMDYLMSQDPELDDDSAREQAWDELQNEYFQGDGQPSLLEFFHDRHIHSWLDVYEAYSNRLTWPHTTSSSGFGAAVEDYAFTLSRVVGAEIVTAEEYHGKVKDFRSGNWYMEPDPSIDPNQDMDTDIHDGSGVMGVEVVSPPMPIGEMLSKFKATLAWARSNGGRTNSSTGFHVGVSMGSSTSNVDYVKLALFLGDDYILNRFGRMANTYARGSVQLIQQRAASISNTPEQLTSVLSKMKRGLVDYASREIHAKNEGKYFSINMRPEYIEFRSIGDDYMNHIDVVENTILRYIRAYAVAADPQAERNEYYKKLSKMLNPNADDSLIPFVQYAMGAVTKDTLIANLTVRKNIKQADKSREIRKQQELDTLYKDMDQEMPGWDTETPQQ